MTDEQLIKFSMNELVSDLKAILDCTQICIHNKVDVAIYQGIIPYLCSFIYSGYKYLESQGLILAVNDKKFLKKIDKSRSKFLKQYCTFNKSTYKSLYNFNKQEYNKFFRKEYPSGPIFSTEKIKNYYIATINDKPIDNYYLSSSIFGCEIGSYKNNIKPPIEKFMYQMVGFICELLKAANVNIEIINTPVILFNEVKYADINMDFNYNNFGIKDNPPILMALLDILCVVNSYNEIFTRINSDKMLDLKVKYLIFFQSVLGLKKINEFCRNSGMDLIFNKQFENFILKMDKSYCKNKLRKLCAHYDYREKDWKANPILEAFEKYFNKSIDEIRNDLGCYLSELGDFLNKLVIKKKISNT